MLIVLDQCGMGQLARGQTLQVCDADLAILRSHEHTGVDNRRRVIDALKQQSFSVIPGRAATRVRWAGERALLYERS